MTLNEGFAYEDHLHRHKGKHRTLCQELLNGRHLSLLEFYSQSYQHSDELSWRKRILKGFISVNGLVCQDPSQSVAVGDHLVYSRPPWIEASVPALTEAMVLFEDADCLVFNKPEGLPVLPSSKFLVNTMHSLARRLRPLPLSPVHRLGRGTTGAILFAKNPSAYRRLCRSLADGEFGKEYLCLAQGTTLPTHFTVDTPIGPGHLRRSRPTGHSPCRQSQRTSRRLSLPRPLRAA
jgi:23S rRNA pseudouridine1911/1915/1917 synthase